MRSPDLHYWTALLPVFYNAPHRGDDFPASDPRQPRIILSPLLRSTTPAVNRLHGPLNLIWHLRWSQCLAWMYYPDLHPREVSIPFLGLACCTFPCNQHRAREQQEKAKQNPRPHPSLPSLSTPSLPPPGPRGRGSAPGARGRWAGAGCSWTGSRRRNAAWGLGDRLLSLLLPTPSRNPSPNFLLWSSRGGAGMQAWTSEPAQSSGSWARARCSWTSYPRRNAAWGLGRHFLSPLLPSLVRRQGRLHCVWETQGDREGLRQPEHGGGPVAMASQPAVPGVACLWSHPHQLPLAGFCCPLLSQGLCSSPSVSRRERGASLRTSSAICYMNKELAKAGTTLCTRRCCVLGTSRQKKPSAATLLEALNSVGDSGGPLVCNLTDAWVLVGLASWGLDCRHPIYPSVFTNVSYFIDWMDEIQRLTPLRNAMSAPPQTQFPHQPLQAAGSPGPGTGFVSPQPWPLLLFLLQDPRQALW
ncbi:uncharacterized protein LOC116151603 isoform X1 [Camelus dromedarius]|uniref:uncharacterized protein LOC116151603 isoform X1 n=1 Tax=Camelus dromedarius TaxID=9838 RepID=UPI0031199652